MTPNQGGDDPGDDPDAYLIEARIADAAEERRRTRLLSAQATEDATLAGVVRDLAERGEIIEVETCAMNRHRASIKAVGNDFVVLDTEQSEVVVALRAIVCIEDSGSEMALGDRTVPLEAGLADILPTMAIDRAPVQVWTVSGRSVRGILRLAGRSVIGIRNRDGRATYVPFDAVAEIIVSI